MKSNDLLQFIYSLFLGIAVVAFIGIAVNTAYPEPFMGGEYANPADNIWANWRLITGVILLASATASLVVSLFWPQRQTVLANGFLIGGVFTMVYAIGMSMTAHTSWLRLAVAACALLVTVGVGWLRFVGRQREASATALASLGGVTSPEVESRLAALERRLDAAGHALTSG